MAYDMTNDEIVEAASRITPQWLAGFFDGEGSICIHKNGGGNCSFQASISQAEPKILALIALKFGVRVYERAAQGRRGFQIKFNGKCATPFLEYIKDHVICKRRQVGAALEFAKILSEFVASTEQVKRRTQLVEIIKQANHGIDTLIEEVKS